MLSRQQFDLMLDLRIYVAFVYTLGSAQLLVVTMDTNKSLNASRIAVGTASDLALQVRCTTTSISATSWTNENGSTVSQGLNPFGISQEDEILRVYPVNLLSEGPNIFSCSDELETLAVQFDRRKCNPAWALSHRQSTCLFHRSTPFLYLTNTRASSSNS